MRTNNLSECPSLQEKLLFNFGTDLKGMYQVKEDTSRKQVPVEFIQKYGEIYLVLEFDLCDVSYRIKSLHFTKLELPDEIWVISTNNLDLGKYYVGILDFNPRYSLLADKLPLFSGIAV